MAKSATATGRKSSPVNENMFEVEGQNAIGNVSPPGTTKNGSGEVELENLGRLSQFKPPAPNDDPENGSGEYFVVLSDFFSGAGEHDNFRKGDVRRLSRLIPGYDDPDVDRKVIEGRIQRHMENGSMRLAASEEQGQGHIAVTLDSESPNVVDERNRRIAAEQENELLREKLGMANVAAQNMVPGREGASDEAKEATSKQNNPTWEEEED